MGAVNDEADELAALRQAFPGYRFRRRNFRGVPCYLAEARGSGAAGRPVPLRPAAVAAAYRDHRLTMQQCAALFGVSRTTIMKLLATAGVTSRRPGREVDEPAVAAAYQDGLSLRECAARFGVSE